MNGLALNCPTWIRVILKVTFSATLRLYCVIAMHYFMDNAELAFTVFPSSCNAVVQTLEFDFDGFFSSVFVHQWFAVLLLMHSEYIQYNMDISHVTSVTVMVLVKVYHSCLHVTKLQGLLFRFEWMKDLSTTWQLHGLKFMRLNVKKELIYSTSGHT